jgi:hypothetical protein
LAKAKEFAETDRVDGRDALNKFIFNEAKKISKEKDNYSASADELRSKFKEEF